MAPQRQATGFVDARGKAESDSVGPSDPIAAETGGEPSEAPKGGGRASRAPLVPLDPIIVVGQMLTWVGALMVLFAVFQLWGTGLLEWRAQQALDAEFEALMTEPRADREPKADVGDPIEVAITPSPVEAPPDAEIGPTATIPAPTAPPLPQQSPVNADRLPSEGTAIGRITIASIGMQKTIVQGVRRDTLRDGPGHYPTTPLPGQPGNAAIAGHRTTHGAPFVDLDKVQPGDHIDVETFDGIFRYEVLAQASPSGGTRGYQIVRPSDVGVIADHGDDRLTLTACHPKYSARQRIVVSAVLIGEPADTTVIPAEPEPVVLPIPEMPPPASGPSPEANEAADDLSEGVSDDPGQTIGVEDDLFEESLGWQRSEIDPTVMWATITLVIAHAGWILGRLWRRRFAYLASLPIAAVPLFICFIHLDRLLPAF